MDTVVLKKRGTVAHSTDRGSYLLNADLVSYLLSSLAGVGLGLDGNGGNGTGAGADADGAAAAPRQRGKWAAYAVGVWCTCLMDPQG